MVDNVLSVYQLVFGIVGLLAGAFAVFRHSFFKQTTELLRQDRDDANERVENLRKDFDEFKKKANAEKKALQDEATNREILLTEKNQEIHTLRSIVTGKDQLDRIEKFLTDFAERLFNDRAAEQNGA